MKAEVDLVTSAGGNLGSISRCLRRLGIVYNLSSPENPPQGDLPIILPGVGHFGAVMNSLCQENFDRTICSAVRGGTPFLGVCVGMQILFQSSEEAPGVKGLGLIPGAVRKFKTGKVPQIGWNEIGPQNDLTWPKGFVYFVNSYYPDPERASDTLYQSQYYGPFCAAVKTGNITAFQFHPEKSGEFGESLLKRWLRSVA